MTWAIAWIASCVLGRGDEGERWPSIADHLPASSEMRASSRSQRIGGGGQRLVDSARGGIERDQQIFGRADRGGRDGLAGLQRFGRSRRPEPPSALIEAASVWVRSIPGREALSSWRETRVKPVSSLTDDHFAGDPLLAEARGDPVDDLLDRADARGERLSALSWLTLSSAA